MVALGLSTYSAVQNYKSGNYFSGSFSAIMAFESASDIYSESKSQNSGSETKSSGGDKGLDASPASSVSGSGNETVELKTRDIINKTINKPVENARQIGSIQKSPFRIGMDLSVDIPSVDITVQAHLVFTPKDMIDGLRSGAVGLNIKIDEMVVTVSGVIKGYLPSGQTRVVSSFREALQDTPKLPELEMNPGMRSAQR